MTGGDKKPKLRFIGFTDEWVMRDFMDIFEYERPDNYIVTSDEYSNENSVPVLTANKGFILGYTNEQRTYNKPSIIFDDFTLDCKYVDFPYMVKSSAIKILTIKNSKQDDLKFTFALLNSTRIDVLGHARHYISVVQPTLIYIPTINEQKKVSKLLTDFDSLIALHQRKHDKLCEVKKTMLEKMFPKDGAEIPEIRFKGFTGKWGEKKLREITKFSSSKRVHMEDYVDSGIPFFRGSEISKLGSSIKIEDILYISEEFYNEIKTKNGVPQIGDILITAVGTLCNSFLVRDNMPFYFKDGNLIWLSDIKINSEYLEIYLGDGIGKKRVLESAIGSNQKALTMVKLQNVQISVPENKEQNQIVAFFKNLDSLISLHQRELDKLKNIKKACLEKMFI